MLVPLADVRAVRDVRAEGRHQQEQFADGLRGQHDHRDEADAARDQCREQRKCDRSAVMAGWANYRRVT
jgi:hypothetical protein